MGDLADANTSEQLIWISNISVLFCQSVGFGFTLLLMSKLTETGLLKEVYITFDTVAMNNLSIALTILSIF